MYSNVQYEVTSKDSTLLNPLTDFQSFYPFLALKMLCSLMTLVICCAVERGHLRISERTKVDKRRRTLRQRPQHRGGQQILSLILQQLISRGGLHVPGVRWERRHAKTRFMTILSHDHWSGGHDGKAA